MQKSSINGFSPPEPYDEISLTVKPQEIVTLSSDNRLKGCKRIDVLVGQTFSYYQLEGDYVHYDKADNLKLIVPFELGEYLIRMDLTFRRGEIEFYVYLIVKN